MEVLDEPEAKASLTACPRGSMWLLTPPPLGVGTRVFGRHAVATQSPRRPPSAGLKPGKSRGFAKQAASWAPRGFEKMLAIFAVLGRRRGILNCMSKAK